MLHTNFNKLKEVGFDESKYRKLAKALGGIQKYGKDTPISLIQVLDSNGLDDALWALRATIEDSSRFSTLLAANYAYKALPLFEAKHPDDSRPREAIVAAVRFANGEIGEDELKAAQVDAWNAAWNTARAIARDSAWNAARAAAKAAAWDAARAAAWNSARAATWNAAWDDTQNAALAAARSTASDAAWADQANLSRRALEEGERVLLKELVNAKQS